MTCKNAKKIIKACLDGELPRDEQEILKQHLKTCPECSQEADSLSKAWELLLELPREKEIPALIPGVLNRISQEEERPFLRRIMEWRTVFQTSFATAAVLAMIIGFIMGFGIAKFLPVSHLNVELTEDPLYLEIFTDTPPSSISDAYMYFISEEEEGTL